MIKPLDRISKTLYSNIDDIIKIYNSMMQNGLTYDNERELYKQLQILSKKWK